MRLRNENLKTGKALAWIDPAGVRRSRVLLFLIEGADDIQALNEIETAGRSRIEERRYEGFAWYPIADPGQISLVDQRLYSADIRRFEAHEFRDLQQEQVSRLLSPLIDHVANGSVELLPRTGGAVGGPAEGIQFLNRTAELAELEDSLRKGMSFFLQAPRRMGKTSVMRRLESTLSEDFETLFLNLERNPRPEECAARLRSEVTKEGLHAARRAAKENAYQVLHDSVASLCERAGKPMVFFVDELVAALEAIKQEAKDESARRQRTVSFLAALGGPLKLYGARMVVAGSINWLDYLDSELGLKQQELPGQFADLSRRILKPLDLEDPECELRRLLLGSALVAEPEDIAWLCEHVDLTVPFPAVKFLDQVAGETKASGNVDVAELKLLLEEFLRTTDAFADFDEHLNKKSPSREATDAIGEALTAIAREPFEVGVSRERVNTALLHAGGKSAKKLDTWLRETFPVIIENNKARFASRLFRLWWLSQVGEASADE